MTDRSTVFVFALAEYGFAREIVRGARAYAIAHTQWSMRSGTLPHDTRQLQRINPGPGGGAIAFLPSEPIEQAILDQYQVPVVNVSFNRPQSRLPRVLVDNVEVGRRAARHLISRGFRRFGYSGNTAFGYSQARCHGFTEALEEAGFECERLRGSMSEMRDVLQELRKPIGILAHNDVHGRQLIDICQDIDTAVPEQVAVIGADNDVHVCESSPVPLTSVDTRGYHVGFRAAQLLDELIQGATPPTRPLLVEAGEVITRRSTDTIAVADPDLNFTMRYIREHACEGLKVENILDHLTISRRTLEKRFKSEFGRTLHDEMRRIQLEHARMLLSETDLPIPDIALRCGFCDRRIFTRVFGDTFGQPPGRFRNGQRQPKANP